MPLFSTALARRPSLFPGSRARGAGADPEANTTFKAGAAPTSLRDPGPALVINGLAGALVVGLVGPDATGAAWAQEGGLPTLAIASTGTAPTLGVPAPVTTPGEGAVRLNGGQVYQEGGTVSGAIGLDDFVVEAVVWVPTFTVATAIAGTKSAAAAGTGNGWALVHFGTAGITLRLGMGATASTFATGVGTLVPNAWNHVLIFVDRDVGAASIGGRVYVNGAYSNAGSPAATAATSIVGDGPLTVGASSALTDKPTGVVLGSLRIWTRPSWFPNGAGGVNNPALMDAVALERSYRLQGSWPQIALGTPAPLAATRTTAATYDKVLDDVTGLRGLMQVGVNWTRFCRRREALGGELLAGFLCEAQATNLLLQSETLADAAWTKAAASVNANAALAPTLTTVMDGIAGDATNAQHGVTQAATLTAAAYVLSWWSKAGAQGWVYLDNATVPNARAWFNLTTGQVGTVGAGVAEALCEPWGDGRWRCSIRFTGTAAAHTLGAFAAPADNVTTYVGSNVNDVFLWGAQVELHSFPQSYVPTTTATASRTIDALGYKANDGNFVVGPTTVECELLDLNRDEIVGRRLVQLGPDASALTPDAMLLSIGTADAFQTSYTAAGVSQMSSTSSLDVIDGEKHALKSTIDTNNGRIFVDGAQVGTTDTSLNLIATAPAGIFLGPGSVASNLLVGNVRIKKVA